MALARRVRQHEQFYWPGFVDAMATLLLVIIFLLSIFMLVLFLQARDISGQDSVLNRLRSEIASLSEMLALERAGSSELEATLATLTDSLTDSQLETQRLQGLLDEETRHAAAAGGQVSDLSGALEDERRVRDDALAQVELLNQQISALRRQLASLQEALGAAESADEQARAQIEDLGRRLNAALAQRVQQLARYRSEFFGKLREILSQRSDIRVVGDRFVFQADIFFAKGEATLNRVGQQELDKLAEALLELEGIIPDDILWVLRIDGHTDSDPIRTAPFPSNWELSTARAISVVQYLMRNGVAPNRLVAAGFAEFQPLDSADTEDAKRRNRRIELKLTER
jgi:chemotaxis protein MotB